MSSFDANSRSERPAGMADAGQETLMDAPQERVASVDALRGLVILLMIFVNDVAGVAGAPGWLQHADGRADAMTLPDVVFPAFLFIAGVSIPLAFSRALARGQTKLRLVARVLARTFALLVMGVLMVNMERHNPWHRGLWGLAAYLAMLLTFSKLPRRKGKMRTAFAIGRMIGVAALLGLVLSYRTVDGKLLALGPLFDTGDTVWLRHQWWGILGLIGWAYLVASLVYLLVGNRREWLIGATAMLATLYVASDAGLFSRIETKEWLAWASPAIQPVEALAGWVNSHVGIGSSLGSLASITMAGCCLGAILVPGSEVRSHAGRVRWAVAFGLGLVAAALLFDPLYGISKIRATPSWCLLCSALTAWTWALLYWVMDVRGFRGWAVIVRPAGENPLLAYLLHPLAYSIAGVTGIQLWFYKSGDLPVGVSILGSLVMAFAMVGLAGLIGRAGFRLKV